MESVEFKRENGKLYFRTLILEQFDVVTVNYDGDDIYNEAWRVKGYTDWVEVP